MQLPQARLPARAPEPCLSTRQDAKAFNQPVSFDTSRVTTMWYIFFVRSAARALPPRPSSRGSSACVPLVLPLPHALAPAVRFAHTWPPYRMPCFRLGSTRRPSTSRLPSTRPTSWTCKPCSRCAHRACSAPTALQPGPPRACRLLPHARPSSPASRPAHLAPPHMPCFRLGRARRPSTSR